MSNGITKAEVELMIKKEKEADLTRSEVLTIVHKATTKVKDDVLEKIDTVNNNILELAKSFSNKNDDHFEKIDEKIYNEKKECKDNIKSNNRYAYGIAITVVTILIGWISYNSLKAHNNEMTNIESAAINKENKSLHKTVKDNQTQNNDQEIKINQIIEYLKSQKRSDSLRMALPIEITTRGQVKSISSDSLYYLLVESEKWH